MYVKWCEEMHNALDSLCLYLSTMKKLGQYEPNIIHIHEIPTNCPSTAHHGCDERVRKTHCYFVIAEFESVRKNLEIYF
jgi:hypothetical protein